MKMEKGFFLAALLACAAIPAMAAPSGPAAGPNASQPTVSPAGPPTPAGAAQVDPASDDMAARIALDQAEAVRAEVPSHPQAVGRPAPASTSAADTSITSAGLGGIMGLGLSAAFLALGLLFLASQRKHLRAIFKRTAPAPRAARPATSVAPSMLANALRSTTLRKPAAVPASTPVPVAAAGSEVDGLRLLARELQGTISELRAERARWEKEWEQREMQWSRWMRTLEPGGAAASEARPVACAAERPAALLEAENDSLPSLADAGASLSDSAGVLQKVEQLLAQGMSAEEISRRLRVGLREIQWMMRLGAMESRS